MSGQEVKRSNSYRKVYLKRNPGIFHKWYICSYCRKKLLVKDIMEVDHIISIHAVKTMLRFRLLFMIINKDVNDVLNLTCSCHDCNHTKSGDTKGWLIRGYTGSLIHYILQTMSNILEEVFKKYWYILIVIIIALNLYIRFKL